MPIEPNERPLLDLVLADNEAENTKELSQDGAIRWIRGRVIINMTNTATPPTFTEDDILNYIKAIGVRRNGRFFKTNVPLKFSHHLTTKVRGTPPSKVDPIVTASATYDAIVNFQIDFAENPLDENDVSALLQTKNLTSLDLVVATGDVSDISSANAPTINTRTVELEIRDFQGDIKGNNINDDKLVKMTDIIEQTEEIDLLAGKTQFDKLAQDVDLVAGANIFETALMVTDNGIRSDARVTDLKVQRVRPRKSDKIEHPWKNLKEAGKHMHGIDTEITGFVRIDWQEKLGRQGLLTGAKSSELLKLLTNGIVATQDKIEVYTKSV